MPQRDYTLANSSGAAFRGALNTMLGAIASLNSGATAPSTTYGDMLWLDTSSGILKRRDTANTSWLSVLYFDDVAQSVGFSQPFDVNVLSADTVTEAADLMPFRDVSAATVKKASLANLIKSMSGLNTLTSPAIDDVLALYVTASSFARGISMENLIGSINTATELTTPDSAADFLPIYDTAGGLAKKVKLSNLVDFSSGIELISGGSFPAVDSKTIIDIPSTYKQLIIQFSAVRQDSGSNKNLMIQFSDDNGATFDTTVGNYIGWYVRESGADGVTDQASATSQHTGTNNGYLYGICIARGYQIPGGVDYSTAHYNSVGPRARAYGHYKGSTGPIDAIKFLWDAACNFSSGSYGIYGVK